MKPSKLLSVAVLVLPLLIAPALATVKLITPTVLDIQFPESWYTGLESFLSTYFQGVDVSQLVPVGGINEGIWQGSKWNGKWYKLDNFLRVPTFKKGSRTFFRISTREPLPKLDKSGHYLYWEFILEDKGNSNFRVIKKMVAIPCRERAADMCPLESLIDHAEIRKHEWLSVWLKIGEDNVGFRKVKYEEVEGKWTETYRSQEVEIGTLK